MTTRKDAHPVTHTAEEGRLEVRLSGFGGQGIVLAGNILGRSVALYEGKNAVFTQSYGPEARGGACSADVVISEGSIHYPKVARPDILVFMSEEAKNTYGKLLEPETTVIIDQDLVRNDGLEGRCSRLLSIPATRFAEELGRKMVANIVMLGFLTAVTGIVRHDSLKNAVLASVPKGTEELNTKAFEKGYQYGQEGEGGKRG
ncbi:MAG: 2-oxoacid:acceptor oxidoreductase family protein [Thermodesulfobacteriota bacterium]